MHIKLNFEKILLNSFNETGPIESTQDISGWKNCLGRKTTEQYTKYGECPSITIWDAALRFLETVPDQVVVVDGAENCRVHQLIEADRKLSAALHEAGLRPGDVISFQLPNWWETVVINLAACTSGLIFNPIVPIYREGEVRYILRDARIKVFFVTSLFSGFDYAAMASQLRSDLPELEHVILIRGASQLGMLSFDALLDKGRIHKWNPPTPNPNAIKLVLYTSGTTGSPKGMLHSHNTLMSEVNAVIRCWEVSTKDVVFMPSPVTHVTGYLYGLEMPFVVQCSVVLMERWEAALAANLIDLRDATLIVGGTLFLIELKQQVVKCGWVPSMRVFACGGAPVSPEIVRKARIAMVNCAVFRVYGSSEAPTVTLGLSPNDDADVGVSTDGRIVNNFVRLCDPAGIADVPAGQEGEVTVKGPEVMLGYTNWDHTQEAFDKDSFFHTGDLAVISHGDLLIISGRKKDFIIRGGENISAKEIEDILHANPSIAEVEVVAMPYPRLSEGVCAFVVAAQGAVITLGSIAAILDVAGLARQKYPERVEVEVELPRTASGKVKKLTSRSNSLDDERREYFE
jgi:acyl-CoA synthetase (AMP-forming)/AMP-acid ligase II